MREMSYLRLEGRESSWHCGGKQPANLKAWWLKMSFRTIVAALARVIASSEQSRFFKASFSIFSIPFLNSNSP